MKLTELIGKRAVRTKSLERIEHLNDGMLYSGRKVLVPDSAWTTRPVLVTAVEDGVVYIQWRAEYGGHIYREILDPKYHDDNWAPVNDAYLEAK
jgi:hypothetical protein